MLFTLLCPGAAKLQYPLLTLACGLSPDLHVSSFGVIICGLDEGKFAHHLKTK